MTATGTYKVNRDFFAGGSAKKEAAPKKRVSYYAGGMLQPGNYGPGNAPGNGGYRYGFNGKEKDNNGEWGLTNYDYGFRIYNPAIGRFLSVDPLTKDYPFYTPYQFAGNDVIRYVDLDGLEPMQISVDKRYTKIQVVPASDQIPQPMLPGSGMRPKFQKPEDHGDLKISVGKQIGINYRGIGVEINAGSKEVFSTAYDGPNQNEKVGFNVGLGVAGFGASTETTTKTESRSYGFLKEDFEIQTVEGTSEVSFFGAKVEAHKTSTTVTSKKTGLVMSQQETKSKSAGYNIGEFLPPIKSNKVSGGIGVKVEVEVKP